MPAAAWLQEHITSAINYVVFAFFAVDLGLNLVARGFLLTPSAYLHVRSPAELHHDQLLHLRLIP